MSKKRPVGVVYSTNPDYEYAYDTEPQPDTLPPSQQPLRIRMERNHRGGKTVTVVRGFVGTDDDLVQLGRWLKTKCGVGGTAKEGEIVIQGDHVQRVRELLVTEGYTSAR